jgi:hypothetical protein
MDDYTKFRKKSKAVIVSALDFGGRAVGIHLLRNARAERKSPRERGAKAGISALCRATAGKPPRF